MPRREVAPASIAVLVFTSWACATASNGRTDSTGRSLTRGQPTSGYEVREAAEAADTDGLQISLERGVISQQAAQDAVMARWKELTLCYGEAGAAMSFAGGPVTLRFLVDGKGDTTDVRIIDSQLGSFPVERCLIAVGRRVQFPRPQGNATAQVDYTLEFRSTGGTGVVELAAEEVSAELPRLYGRLAGDCERLGADEVTATLYVDAAGTVRSVGLAAEASLDETSAGCVATALLRVKLRLPAVRSGVGRLALPLRGAELVAYREQAELRRYSRASTPRFQPRRGRVRR